MHKIINQPSHKYNRYHPEQRFSRNKKNIKVFRDRYPLDFFQAPLKSMECTFFPNKNNNKRAFPQLRLQNRKMSVSADSHSRIQNKYLTLPSDPLKPIIKLIESQQQIISFQNSLIFDRLQLPKLQSSNKMSLGLITHR